MEIEWVEEPSYSADYYPDYDDPLPDQPDHGIRCILFDLDGVLVDAADWHRGAFDYALIYHGFEPLGDEEHEKRFNGLSTRKKISMLVEEDRLPTGTNLLYDEIYKSKQEATVNIIKEKCKPVTRIIDTINFAKSIGMKVGVVTNCSRKTCELMLNLSKLYDLFDAIITNNDVDGKIKPHPRPYLMGRRTFNVSYKGALAIDDTDKGIISAVDAGCRTWRLKNFDDLSVMNLMRVLKKYRITI